jgi:uncharacterized membrane protein
VKGKYRQGAIIIVLLIPAITILALPLYHPGEMPLFLLMLGRFHPIILHFPIVLILMALAFEIVRRNGWLRSGNVVMVLLLAAALSTLASVMAGFFLFASGEYSGELMDRHFLAGVITGAAIFLTGALFFVYRMTSRFYFLYFFFLIFSNVAVAWAGHLGGSITHGRDYLTEYLPFLFKGSGMDEVRPEHEMLIYADMLAPVFEAKCLSCHNDDRAKGELRMTSVPDLLKGGESGRPGLTSGDPEKSEMYIRVVIPEDGEDHMPPEGKTPLTEKEIALLRYWIASGASEELKVTEARTAEGIDTIITALLPDLARYRRKSVIAKMKAHALERELAELASKLGVSIQPDRNAEGNYFTLAMKFPPAPFTNDQFRELAPYSDVFSGASLVASGIDDAGLYYVSHMVNLKELYLQKTGLDGSGLVYLQDLPNLEMLNLSFTKIDDKAALDLLKIPGLKTVYLFGTPTSNEVIEAMRKYRPDLSILLEEGPYF